MYSYPFFPLTILETVKYRLPFSNTVCTVKGQNLCFIKKLLKVTISFFTESEERKFVEKSKKVVIEVSLYALDHGPLYLPYLPDGNEVQTNKISAKSLW